MHKIIAKYFIFLPGQAIRGEYIHKYIRHFEKTQFLDKKILEEIQFEKLKALISHAENRSPFYKDLFKKHGIVSRSITDKNDLLKIPFLTKNDLSNSQKDLLSQQYSKRFSQKTTGGSTGQAVTLIKDRKAMACQDAAMWRCLRWFNIDIGDKQARFWGTPIDPGIKKKYQCIDFFMNRIRFSAFNFDDKKIGAFLDTIKQFKPKYFYGYVSIINEFAQYCEANNINTHDLGIKAIVTTSEPLFQERRDYFKKIFQCQIINDYGCGEVGPIAYDCPSGGFHLMTDNLFIEIINEKGLHADEGETGEIVVTELHNYSLPLIRYNLKDMTIATKRACACGRGLPLIIQISGRVLDVLIAANGDKIHGEYFNYIAEEIKKKEKGLKQYQVIQKSLNNLVVKIIKDRDFSNQTIYYLQNKIKERMGKNIKIDIEFVTQIQREKSGKLRLVKCEIKQ